MGLFSSSVGIGRGIRLFRDAIVSSGGGVVELDCTPFFGHSKQAIAQDLSATAIDRALVVHLNPIEYLRALSSPKLKLGRRYRSVGYWAWETTQIPDKWCKAMSVVDEIWCPSHFTADAIRRAGGCDLPIRVVPHPLSQMIEVPPSRENFGLPKEAFIFFCVFDHRSSTVRKNPLGTIEAFKRSGLGKRGAILLIKEGGAFANPASSKFLHEAASACPQVQIMQQELSAQDMASLRASIDALISLHRSEGFGLSLAEAMAGGKPVIATGWSGNTDFMCQQTAFLVEYKIAPIEKGLEHYVQGQWAAPDLDHAAALMVTCFEDADTRSRLAARARARVTEQLSLKNWQRTLPDWFLQSLPDRH